MFAKPRLRLLGALVIGVHSLPCSRLLPFHPPHRRIIRWATIGRARVTRSP